MKNIRVFLSNFFFSFLEVKFSIYLYRRVFVMDSDQIQRRKSPLQKLRDERVNSDDAQLQITNICSGSVVPLTY